VSATEGSTVALTRETVLDHALEILDTYGLGDLTMRRLATALKVQPGALYWHYANKQALLAAVTERILSEVGTRSQAPDGDWGDRLVDWGLDLRRVLLAHRDGAELAASAIALSLGELAPERPMADLLAASGLSAGDAAAVASAALHQTLGLTLNEQSRAQAVRLGVLEGPAPDQEDRLRLALELIVTGVRTRFGV